MLKLFSQRSSASWCSLTLLRVSVDKTVRPAQQPTTAKGATWSAPRMQVPKQEAALIFFWMYYCSRVLAAA